MAQFIDFIIDGGIFFNIGIGRRDISFGLVIIIIRDEIFHCVFGEKLFKLRAKLRRQGFIVRQHKRRALDLFNNIGHSKCLARTGYAEQRLFFIAFFHALA